jgi:hypothetical protein
LEHSLTQVFAGMACQGVEKREKPQKIRHTGAGRYPEAVDFVDHVALDPGLRRGDGVFFNTLLIRPQSHSFWRLAGRLNFSVLVNSAARAVAWRATQPPQ